ncbi:MAG: T9SS type A sorting domain-containing protein [Saprospiraceae bacterium]|nr:T9SS type A sorting domain-containing protein [Saprospiraceae bacterium]
MSEDGNIVAIGAPFDFGSFQNSGSVRVYNLIGNDWIQIGEIIKGETFAESSGSTLALSADGKTLIVAAPNYNVTGVGSGIVRTYTQQNNQWVKLGSDIKGQEKDMLGTSIDLSSNGLKLAIGASQSTSLNIGKGYVQIYEMINNEWIKLGQALIGEQVNDHFGSAVSFNSSGDLLTIGARSSDKFLKDAGQIDLYQLNNNEWIQIGTSIYGDHESEGIGSQLMISGDGSTFIVGSQFNDDVGTNAGKVSVYNLKNLTSSKEVNNSRQIRAFPNPVNHLMTIEHTDYNEFVLLNSQGKKIENLIITNGQINFQNLSTGVYYLICKSAINYKTIQVVKI